MQPCCACGRLNKCCIARADYETGEVKKYCCQCVPGQTVELMGHPLASKEKCEVENELCCFSKPSKKESD
jgi:hypothetical protein